MTQKQVQAVFFLVLLAAVGVLFALFFRPYATTIVLAATFGVVFWPLYDRVRRAFGGREVFASLATTLVVLVLVVLPFAILAVEVVRSAMDAYAHFTNFAASASHGAWQGPVAIAPLIPVILEFGGKLQASQQIFLEASQRAFGFFTSASALFLRAMLFFIVLYYAFKDGETLRRRILVMSPFDSDATERLLDRMHRAVRAAFGGTFVIMLIQGAIAGIGFWVFGVPSPLFLGTLACFASIVPVVGIAVIIVPVVAYLFFTGAGTGALGLAVWSSTLHVMVDNLLKPKIIERGMDVHPLIIILAVIGGIDAFGFSGFVIGPIVAALALALADLYREEFHTPFAKG